jgi:hypothetical protein
MKKTILLFAFISISFLSCTSSDDAISIDSEQLIGTWFLQSTTINGEVLNSSDEIDLEFTSNQRAFFTYYNYGSNGQDFTDSADYSLNGNNIIFTWDDPEPGNETFTYEILELTSTTLKVKSFDGVDTVIEIYNK